MIVRVGSFIALVVLCVWAYPSDTPRLPVLAAVKTCHGTSTVGYVIVNADGSIGSFDVLSEEALDAQNLLAAKGRLRLGILEFASCGVAAEPQRRM